MTQTGFSITMTNCTSSYIPFNNDWSDVLFDKDFTTPDNSELFSELGDALGCSIYQDIKQIIENQSSPFESSNSSVTSEIYETPKYEIRNHDCMWSGATINNLAIAGGAIKREPIDIIDINHKIKIEPGEIESDSDESQENNHHQQHHHNQHNNHHQKKQQKHKQQHRISDDDSTDHKHAVHMQKFQNQQLLQQQQQQNQHQKQQNHNNNNNEEFIKINTNISSSPNTKSQKHQNMQSIPAGASLLLSSPMNQQKKVSNVNNHRPSPIQIPTITPLDFIRDRENYLSISSNDGNNNINNCGGGSVGGGGGGGMSLCRPDTPLSLDDDAPEFKHSVDLAACVTGTNSLVLDNETMIINKLRAQLEDVSKENIDMQLLNDGHQHHINDVLSVIDNECNYNSYRCNNSKDKDRYDNNSNYDISLLKLNNNIGDVYINNRYGGNNCNRRRDGCIENSDGESTDSDGSEDDDDEEEEDSISAISKSSMIFTSSQNTTTTLGHSVMHSDHSYTRSKDGVDVTGMGMETPSDSDEEIDVVSIGDKKLPTNPSDKDCRVLLNKISARMVKTPNGLRTIPPRRRGSYDPPYTPANSITPIKSGSSLASSRYPSPTSTPYSYSSSNGVGSTKYHSNNSLSNSSSRKRSGAVSLSSSTSSYRNVDDYAPPSNKRQRSKKQKSSSVTPVKQQHNRHYSVDEADTIEKRNLHNNMERQRRIGLKNLFEALKKQIPSIKDKERAPKVNILREAAKLCSQLTRDYEHMTAQQQVLQDQIRNRQEFLNRLKVLRSIRSD